MSSIDRAVMLEALGWSRGGIINNHLPDDIVGIIHKFTFFDRRTKEYEEHLKKEDIKATKQNLLRDMIFQINDGLRRCGTGKYGVEYNNIVKNCCMACGNFWGNDMLAENLKCYCRFISEEEIMDLESARYDNYFWEEEEDAERDRERRRINREFDNKFGDWDYETYSLEDDDYNYEGSECSLDYEDYYDDNNSYF
jgi:hypothetical protein